MVLPIAAALIVGCVAKNATPVSERVNEASVAVATESGKIHASAGFIGSLADFALKAKTLEAARPHLEQIRDEAKNIDDIQTKADGLNADERKAFQDQIDSMGKTNKQLEDQLREANAKPFYLVKLFGGLFGLGGLVVGAYFAFSGKVLLNGGALMIAGAVSLGVALAVAHLGWLIALLIVAGLTVIGIPIVTNATHRMKRAAVSIAEGNRALQVAGKQKIDSEAAELLDEKQTPLAKKYVDVVTNKVRKAKANSVKRAAKGLVAA